MNIVTAEHLLDQRIGEKGLSYSQNKPLGRGIIGTIWHCVDVFLRES